MFFFCGRMNHNSQAAALKTTSLKPDTLLYAYFRHQYSTKWRKALNLLSKTTHKQLKGGIQPTQAQSLCSCKKLLLKPTFCWESFSLVSRIKQTNSFIERAPAQVAGKTHELHCCSVSGKKLNLLCICKAKIRHS